MRSHMGCRNGFAYKYMFTHVACSPHPAEVAVVIFGAALFSHDIWIPLLSFYC